MAAAFRVVIPARHASARLPGKPLADIGGHPEKTVPVRAMSQEPTPAGIVHGAVRGLAVSPLIRRPYFNALFT